MLLGRHLQTAMSILWAYTHLDMLHDRCHHTRRVHRLVRAALCHNTSLQSWWWFTTSGAFECSGCQGTMFGAGQVAKQHATKLTALSATGHLTSSVAAGRLSYAFAFQGPSLPVDTVCSSSLVSLHLAATAVGRRECSLALNAGQ